MTKGTLLVIGATGDVGQGIVAAALDSGRKVIAAGRDAAKLERLAAMHTGRALHRVTGDISTEEGAAALWENASQVGAIDAVVVSVNAPSKLQPLTGWTVDELAGALRANLLSHFIAAKVFAPRLADTALLLAIGGGTADFIPPNMTYMSMAQAALRMMYRGLARERKQGAELRELMIVSMVNGESSRGRAKPEWVTDLDIGRHVCAILDAPGDFPGPILQLKSRDQVGRAAASA